jgi:capsule polysaccharide export protein KpsE/RkpR
MKQKISNSELKEALHPRPILKEMEDRDPPNSLLDRLPLLWERRKFLFRLTVCGLLVFTLMAFTIPKRFQSTAQLMPPDSQSSSGMALAAAFAGRMSGALSGLAGSALGLKTSGDLFIGILRSRTVQDDLIDKFGLKKVYHQPLSLSARKTLSSATLISEDRESGIITITVTDQDPNRAAAMAREYVVELNLVVNQLTTSSARREREFLEGRLEQVKDNLEAAEKEFGEFSSKNTAVDIKEQAKAMVGAAATLQGELIATESQLEGLKAIYTENNVRVRSLRARAAELQSQLNKLGGKDESSSSTDASAAPGEDQPLYPSIRKLPMLGVSYADLYRRTKVQEAIFETLTQEYEMARVAEAKEIPTVKVLDTPEIPEHKSSPPRLLIMILGTFFTFGFGVAWILGKALWSEVHPDAPQKIVVGEIVKTVKSSMPWAEPNGSRLQAASHKVWLKLANGSGEKPE